jgi:preprotein translocase subunit YajC
MIPLLAQEAPAAPPGPQPVGGCGPIEMTFLLLLIAVWWFLLIRPQQKAEKARKAKIEAIQKGDRVRTRGGIEGVVSRVQDDKVVLRIDVDGKVHVPFSKAYVEDVLGPEGGGEASKS